MNLFELREHLLDFFFFRALTNLRHAVIFPWSPCQAQKELLIKKVMLKDVNRCSKRCLWNFIIAPKSQRRASVLLCKKTLRKSKMQTKEKSKLTFQLDIKFIHFQLFSFFLADLQWRHLSANKSTLWWHSGLSWPGEDCTLLCNII